MMRNDKRIREMNGRLYEALETIGAVKGEKVAMALDHAVKAVAGVVQVRDIATFLAMNSGRSGNGIEMIAESVIKRVVYLMEGCGATAEDFKTCYPLALQDLKDFHEKRGKH